MVTARNEAPAYFFSNKIGRIIFLSLEKVAGSESMRTILSCAKLQDRFEGYPPNDFVRDFAFDDLGRIQQALDELYGPRAGRRLARRMGRVCFRLGIEDLRSVLGVADLLLRILPLRMRLRLGFEVLRHMFERFSDQQVELEEGEDYFWWVTKRCGVCWGRTTETPCCHLTLGLLQEGLYWLTGGARFFMEESSCIAAGHPTCTIVIGKQPLLTGDSTEDTEAI